MDENALLVALQNGPVAVAVEAVSPAFQHYTGGVLAAKECFRYGVDHGLLLVGYSNVTGQTPYWKLQNSWGANWGEKGYIRLAFGSNICGWATEPRAPVGVEPAAGLAAAHTH